MASTHDFTIIDFELKALCDVIRRHSMSRFFMIHSVRHDSDAPFLFTKPTFFVAIFLEIGGRQSNSMLKDDLPFLRSNYLDSGAVYEIKGT